MHKKIKTHLNTVRVNFPKPRTKKAALEFIGLQTQHGTDTTGAFVQPMTYAINVKIWHWHFDSEEQREAWGKAVDSGMEFWDWHLYAEEFEKKHNAKVTFAGRSSGWIILLDQHGYAPYDTSSMYELQTERSAKEVVALAQVLWEFHRLVAELAEDFIYFAEEADHEPSTPDQRA